MASCMTFILVATKDHPHISLINTQRQRKVMNDWGCGGKNYLLVAMTISQHVLMHKFNSFHFWVIMENNYWFIDFFFFFKFQEHLLWKGNRALINVLPLMNGIGSPVNMTASTRPMSARSTINLTVLMPRAIHNHFLNDRVLGNVLFVTFFKSLNGS